MGARRTRDTVSSQVAAGDLSLSLGGGGAGLLLRDVPWALGRFLLKNLVRALPVGAHWELARIRGGVHDRVAPVPRAMRDQIEATLGPGSETEGVIRRTHQFSRASRFMYVMPGLRGFEDRDRWPLVGRERLDAALQDGRGAILLNAHYGYGPAVGPILRLHGYPVTQVVGARYLEGHRAALAQAASGSRLRTRVFERTGISGGTFDTDDIAANLDLRPIARALEQNRVVRIAADGRAGVAFRTLGLLGRRYRFSTGFVQLALHARCPLIPIFALPGTRRRPIVLEIEKPLRLDGGDVAAILAEYAGRLDDRLRAAPHLWHRWWAPGAFEAEPPDWSGGDVA